MSKVGVDLARVHLPTLAHEREKLLRAAAHRSRPHARVAARMHQRVHGARHEAVIDEEVLLDPEAREPPLEIAGAIVPDPVAQGQILRSRRRPDWVRLHEAQFFDRAFQREGLEETATMAKRRRSSRVTAVEIVTAQPPDKAVTAS